MQGQLDKALENPKVRAAWDALDRSPGLLIVAGRYVPGMRFAVNASMGLSSIPYRRFLPWSVLGGVLWSVYTCALAYRVATTLSGFPLASLVISSLITSAALAAIYFVDRRRSRAATECRADRCRARSRQVPAELRRIRASKMDSRRPRRRRRPGPAPSTIARASGSRRRLRAREAPANGTCRSRSRFRAAGTKPARRGERSRRGDRLSAVPVAACRSALIVGGALGLMNADSTEEAVASGGLPAAVVNTIGDVARAADSDWWWLLAVGVPLLLWAGYTGAKAVQLIHSLVWDEPPPRTKPLQSSLAFTGVLCAVMAAVALTWWLRDESWLVASSRPRSPSCPLAALWLWVSLHLPHGDAPWQALLPGALVVAIGFQVLHGLIVEFLVPKLEKSTTLYGSLGAMTTLLFFMYFVGRLVVTAPDSQQLPPSRAPQATEVTTAPSG